MISRSGMRALQTAPLSQFADRRDTLKARSGLLAIEAAVRALPEVAPPGLAADLERISASAHQLNELRLINLIRANAVTAKPADIIEMERILGTSGTGVADRLSLPAGPDGPAGPAGPDAATVIQAAQATLIKWQRKAESPLSTQDATVAARIVVRTCEGILADAHGPTD
jgi:hypothetical protein